MRLAFAILALTNRIDLGSYFSRLKRLFDVIPGLGLKREGFGLLTVRSNRGLFFRILIVSHLLPLVVACGKKDESSTSAPQPNSKVCASYVSPYMVQGPDLLFHKSNVALCADGNYEVSYLDGSARTFRDNDPIVKTTNSSGGEIYLNMSQILVCTSGCGN